MSNSSKYDQFYTNPLVSDMCVNITIQKLKEIGIDTVTFLEPSAGSGNFIRSIKDASRNLGDHKYVKKILSYDIDPKSDGIEKRNFLKLPQKEIKKIKSYKNVVTIGNPPFGKRSKSAIEFVNKASEFSDIICFILPLQFEKWSVQSKINNDLELIYSERLEPKSFIYNDKDVSIRCCFQIWLKKGICDLQNLRLMSKPLTKHDDFEMMQYNYTKEALKFFDQDKYKWDFAVPRQGYYDYKLRITSSDNLNPKIQWIFFKAKNDKVLKRLMKIDYEKLSLKNTTIPGFGKADVIEEYNRLYGDIDVK